MSMVEYLFRLDGRVVLITGAAGYLCSPIAKAISLVGGMPILCGRTVARLEKIANDISILGGESFVLPLDVEDTRSCETGIARVKKEFGKLHGVVNGAYCGRAVTIEESTESDFESAFRQNLWGPFLLIKECLPLMKEASRECDGGSSIINIASMYGSVSPDQRIYGDSGKDNPPFYGATKAGLIQLTRYMATHLGQYKIRVNSLSPGAFPPLSIKAEQPEFYAHLCGKNPLGRIGLADELVGAALFLLSDAASYVTGIDLPVDGGWMAW